MKTSCLINNYNYQDYIGEAIDSALHQTVPFDEIVIVDDGSTDRSQEIIREKISGYPNVKTIFKENGGQMSAFNEGFVAATGDLIFFLDADDVYEDFYLEEALAFYQSNPECDFLFCGMRHIGSSHRFNLFLPYDFDFGSTAVDVYFNKLWIGNNTSALSARRSVLEKLFPYPNTEELRVCADELLVYGASIVGAHKFFLAKLLVQYRVHTQNLWFGKYDHDVEYQKRRDRRIDTILTYLVNKYENLITSEMIYTEYRKVPHKKSLIVFCKFLRRSPLDLTKKLYWISKLVGLYVGKKLWGRFLKRKKIS